MIETTCIYCLYNSMHDRYYIGATGMYDKRIKSHIYALNKGNHGNKKMQHDYDNGGVFYSMLIKFCSDYIYKKEEENLIHDMVKIGYRLYNYHLNPQNSIHSRKTKRQ